MKRKPQKLNIAGYVDNAAKNFSAFRIAIYAVISIFLGVALIVTSIGQNYKTSGKLYVSIAAMAIFAFAIMNIMALVKKNKK